MTDQDPDVLLIYDEGGSVIASMPKEGPLFEMEKIVVEAKSRQLKASWTLEHPQPLASVYGSLLIMDAWKLPVPRGLTLWQRFKRRVRILMGRFTMEDSLAEILAAEITNEIDNEIIQVFKEIKTKGSSNV